MTTKQEQALAVQGTISKRIDLSAALLERMGFTKEEFERVMLNALIRNPELQDCDRNSLDVAIADCIQAGLLPDGKQAVIIPRKGKAALQPMYEGRVMLARNANPKMVLVTEAVYEGEEFRVIGGSERKVVHEMSLGIDRRDEKIVAVYAMAKLHGADDWEWVVFDKTQIEAYRSMCVRGNRGSADIWEKHYGEMAKRGPLGRLLKRLPKDPRAPALPDLPEREEAAIDFGGNVVDGVGRFIDMEQPPSSTDMFTGEMREPPDYPWITNFDEQSDPHEAGQHLCRMKRPMATKIPPF